MIKEYDFFNQLMEKFSVSFLAASMMCGIFVFFFFLLLSFFKRAKGDKNSFNNSMNFIFWENAVFRDDLFFLQKHCL